MSDQAAQSSDLLSIRGELKVLKVAVFFMIVFAALNLVALLRLLGVPGLPPLLLLLYRAMDALIVISFLKYCGSRVKVRGIDLLLLIFATYPFLIGIARGNLSITFANDTVIFFMFIAKIVIFRTILSRIHAVTDLDAVFTKPARKLVLWCGLFAVIALAVASVLLGTSSGRYYQAPAELTFAAALVLAQGKIFAYLVFLAIALAAGKRMVMLGLIVIAAVAALAHPKVRKGFIRFLVVGVVFLPVAFIASSSFLGSDLVSVNKILGTFRQIERAMEQSDNLLEILMYTDPGRYVEYVSLLPHLVDWSLWFGNGYGFRYDLDSDFLFEFGMADHLEVTNAHFTPLAITAKFGLFGLMIWIILIAQVLSTRINRKSFAEYACRLAFISMLAQSLFAYSFFINMFVPFYIAMSMVGSRRTKASKLPETLVTGQQRGYG
ncbi:MULTISPECIES: O-antigen ligase family protein [Roseobacteraceae]|uniref:O-Antigen ligase n=3 Tax=Roseobacteraceae TaxID=2854170 RepID=A0A0U1NNP8_9RHOB|nr:MULTISPECIES: O-antigen ligase family protein [Roseobacteraceae]CRK76332.1 O-Antigen ligase [Nereida ignava]CUH61447.1 O-Antigen ligase [Thalassobacter stenotrophicus]SFJ79760.1 O-antigen ligase like membrane protein [Nereida ignava DSM 16309]SHJ09597.1 O-antigen ligase like membrane protein [Thalassobacter stenotrophicus DSM 16310]